MPSRDWKFRIDDIVAAIDHIEQYLSGVTKKNFYKNRMIFDAVVRNLEIIGEASKHLPEHIQKKYPSIPWHQMRGMRNILIHEYFGIDADTVWHTAKIHLPPIKIKLKKLLEQINS